MTATHPTPPTAARDTAAPSLREPWYRTLFMTDLWERFGFYGMQAILVLYAAAPVEKGGLGLRQEHVGSLLRRDCGRAHVLRMLLFVVGLGRGLGLGRGAGWNGGTKGRCGLQKVAARFAHGIPLVVNSNSLRPAARAASDTSS